MADSPLLSLRQRIDTTIASAGETVLNRVHDHYVAAEHDRRSNIIITGLNVLRAAEADFKKIERADSVLYGEDGQPVQQLYTKGRLDEIKKGRERVKRLQDLLDKVAQSNAPDDYKKLEDATKKGGKPDATTDE